MLSHSGRQLVAVPVQGKVAVIGAPEGVSPEEVAKVYEELRKRYGPELAEAVNPSVSVPGEELRFGGGGVINAGDRSVTFYVKDPESQDSHVLTLKFDTGRVLVAMDEEAARKIGAEAEAASRGEGVVVTALDYKALGLSEKDVQAIEGALSLDARARGGPVALTVAEREVVADLLASERPDLDDWVNRRVGDLRERLEGALGWPTLDPRELAQEKGGGGERSFENAGGSVIYDDRGPIFGAPLGYYEFRERDAPEFKEVEVVVKFSDRTVEVRGAEAEYALSGLKSREQDEEVAARTLSPVDPEAPLVAHEERLKRERGEREPEF